MPRETLTILVVLAVTLGVAAFFLGLLRKKIAPRSQGTAAFVAVPVTVLLGIAVSSSLGIYDSSGVAVALLSSFVGMTAVQLKPWTVASLCRSLALVTGLVALWAAFYQDVYAVAVSIGITGFILYLSFLASGSREAE